jgi:DNA-binding protein H-NS
MTTLESIQAKIAKLQAQAESIAVKQASAVLEKIKGLMEKNGLTTVDIEAYVGAKKSGRKPGAKIAGQEAASMARYQNPKTGATWSGRGRAPAWIANARDRSKFLIDSSSQATVSAAKPKAKAAKRAKGPQAPMYIDPKTGATWSGRGRAPAWIANAKDRSKFLIGGSDDVAAKSTSAAAKKAPAKKSAAKKVASAKKVVGRRQTVAKKVAAKRSTAEKVVTIEAVPVDTAPQQTAVQ